MGRNCFFSSVRGAFVLADGLISSVWHESHEPGELYGIGDETLVLVAKLVPSGRGDLKLGGHVFP
jgi:hypothetical protein